MQIKNFKIFRKRYREGKNNKIIYFIKLKYQNRKRKRFRVDK